jgi:two-component system chemotaxis sensor kinase CheA
MEPQDFLQEYVEEVREHLQELERSLLVLEREGARQEEISQLFRAAHSIKGASAYMGFEQIAQLTHEIESLFSAVQASSVEVTPKGVSTLLACVDYIANAVGQLQDSGAEPVIPSSLLEALQGIRAGDDGVDHQASPASGQVDPSQDDFEVDFSSVLFPDMEPSAEEESPGVLEAQQPAVAGMNVQPVAPLSEEDDELLTIFMSTFKENMVQVLRLLSSSPGAALNDTEFRQVTGILQRLRSSCQYMDYEDIASLILRGEESVQKGYEELKTRDDLFRDFLTFCAMPLTVHMPELVIPADLLHPHEPAPISTDQSLTQSETERWTLREDSFQEDDEELLSIFLETFHQQFSELVRLMPASAGAKMTPAMFEHARELIKKLISSSQYMDYDRVANILIEWDDKLTDAVQKGKDDGSHYSELLYTHGQQLESAFPALGPLVPPRAQSEETEILQYLDQEIDRSFDAFENITFGVGGEETPPAEVAAPPAAGDPQPTRTQLDVDKASAPSPSRKGEQPERISVAAEEMTSSATLRVDAQKVDQLLNQVGELVVTRSEFVQTVMTFREMLRELTTQGKLSKQEIRRLRLIGFRLHESTLSLGRVANDLQDSSMRIRMLPISHLFQRFPRIARDQALKLNKKLELFIEGGETEIDKRVLEQMYDPLVQFLRNAIAHGIESPEERLKAGKPEVGTVRLSAYHEGDYVTLEIEDDGRGIDTERLKKALQNRAEMSLAEIDRLSEDDLKYAIFLPGLSTRESVDGNAGRGVGLDVVKENVERMNGTIEVFSMTGQGTRFQVRIPLTVAIIRALLVKGTDQIFTLPLTSVTEILRYRREETHTIEGFEVISLRGKTIPIVHLNQLLNLPFERLDNGHKFIIIVNTSFRDVGLVVDGLMGEREVVIKPIEDDFHVFRGFSGATVLGDGTVSLIVDVSSLLRILRDTMGSHSSVSVESERRLLH